MAQHPTQTMPKIGVPRRLDEESDDGEIRNRRLSGDESGYGLVLAATAVVLVVVLLISFTLVI